MKYYAQEWDRYTTGANYINRLFTYLNRHWVKRERDEGRKGIYPVYTVRLLLQGDEVTNLLTFLHVARACAMEAELFPARAEQRAQARRGDYASD